MLVVVVTSGCSLQKDISKLILVKAVGIDQAGNPETGVRLTAVSEKSADASSKQGGSQKEPLVLVSEGKTVFAADRNFNTFSTNEIFWGHAEYLLVGDVAAREDIRKYLDFFIRNHQNRMNAHIAVVQYHSAEELIKASGDEPVYEKIASLYENAQDVSISEKITLTEFIELLGSRYSAAYLPCFGITSNQSETKGGSDKKNIFLNGYAVFSGTRLKGYLTGKMARGFNWIHNNVHSCVVVVKDPKGKDISLEVIKAKTKIRTKMKDGVPHIQIHIKIISNIGELEGSSDVFHEKDFRVLARQQSDIVREEIGSVLEYARINNVDLFGFGDKLYHQHPIIWEGVKEKWSTLFPRAVVTVNIESFMNSVYNISKPIRYWEGEQ
jgi:spore germination protein KC